MSAGVSESEERDRNMRIVHAFFGFMHEKNIDAWAALWNQDANIFVPYPPQGFHGTISGKEQIVPGFRDLFAHFGAFDYSIRSIYPAVDPCVVIVEWEVKATLPAKEVIYQGSNITVFKFRDGRIAAYHDYFDPRQFQIVVDAINDSKIAAR